MKRIWHALFTLLLLFTATAHSQTDVDKLLATQNKLTENFTTLESKEGIEKLFAEDVLRRKNDALRIEISAAIAGGGDSEKLNQVLIQQTELLSNLLKMGGEDASKIAKASREASGDEQKELEIKVLDRLRNMDVYYQELAETIQWSESRSLDVSIIKQEFTSALETRSEQLLNVYLFTDTQIQNASSRLKNISEEDKAAVMATITRLAEQSAVMLASLETTVNIMETFSLDVTDYKQLLLTSTGDINADVLDYEVALGLLDEWMTVFYDWAFENTPSIIVKLIVFVVIIYITRVLARLVSKAVRKSVSHSKMDFSVLMQDFFVSMASKAVFFIGLLIALSQIGINLGPLLTGFGVAGVVIGFALKDTLSNFASGVMILIYRPFDVEDLVSVSGITGKVRNMNLVSTTIKTFDNQRLIIPNNKIWGDVINNVTAESVRRVDMVFGISYSDDIDKAKAILNSILDEHPSVLKRPETTVKLHTLNSSSVDFVVRPWVKTDDYWDVYWDVNETVKKRFDEEGVSIPFPQRDVHIYNHNENAVEDKS
ncbi:mechanosensitive ion channel family protein [Vibrio maerlii]|uniref:mechanosensitive ion channel family protein n=1 Tax=Vibrio maerlii TaxID=2231648 RepID=UPI000E3C7649|nr:mechanosensitive ion channel family protein [Vibrio maerlii]